jgi:hypothetical protein
VQDEERDRVRSPAAGVNEMQIEPVDLGDEMGERVQLALLRAPVEAVAPVVEQLPEVFEVRPVIPAAPGDLVGPPRARDALAQVGERPLGNRDAERPDD